MADLVAFMEERGGIRTAYAGRPQSLTDDSRAKFVRLAIHELGHTLGHLTDEYDTKVVIKTQTFCNPCPNGSVGEYPIERTHTVYNFQGLINVADMCDVADGEECKPLYASSFPAREYWDFEPGGPGVQAGVDVFEGAAYRKENTYRNLRDCIMTTAWAEHEDAAFCKPCQASLLGYLQQYNGRPSDDIGRCWYFKHLVTDSNLNESTFCSYNNREH